MNLTTSWSAAQSSLANAAYSTAVLSRNITSANEEGYARRIATFISRQFGQGPDVSIERVAAVTVRDAALDAGARAQGSLALAEGYAQLSATIGDPQQGASTGALIGALSDSLLTAASQPDNQAFANAAVQKAADLAGKLNKASATVQSLRQQADAGIAASVERINSLLADFKTANDTVVQGGGAGRSALDAMDARDRISASLSREIGVVVRPQRDGGSALYTDSGIALFDRAPRTVRFNATPSLAAGASGQPVVIDGVDASSSHSPMPIGSGKIGGLIALRDKVSTAYQSQLDETARGLINVFAERDQRVPATAPDAPGLFTYAGAPALPTGGLRPGIAGQIRVNPNADPAQGGDVRRLRDGGIASPGNPAYVYNSAHAAGFSQRLQDLSDALGSRISFDPAAGLGASQTLANYAAASSASVEQGRQQASGAADQASAMRDRAAEALSNAAGVNIDDESARMLEVERSYQASAKLISAIDGMFGALLKAV